MPSPDSGTSSSRLVSAMRDTASSDCPTPTVSTRIRSKPAASRTSHTSRVEVARPPSEPRVAIERMNTPGSSAMLSIRIRSPSRAPPEKGLVGSTATTATVCPWARSAATSRSVSVDLPAPGGPVMPIRWARPRLRMQRAEERLEPLPAVFDHRNGACQGGGLARAETGEQGVTIHDGKSPGRGTGAS